MADVGGLSAVPSQPMQVSAPTAPTQKAAVPTEKPKVSKEQFGQTKTGISLPTTNRSALTQLSSKDQKVLMQLGQGGNAFVGKTSQNLQGARLSLQTEVLPKSLLGAGQLLPPSPMRALAAAYGKVFAGRAFELQVGKESANLSFRICGKSFNATITPKRKKGAKYAENQEEEIEESI